MVQVKFLYGATIFEKDGSRSEIQEGEIHNVYADFRKGGYRMMTILLNNNKRDVIFDSEDMKVC